MSLIKALDSGISSATSYLATNVSTKVSEAASSLFGTFGGAGKMDKIAAQAKTFKQMQADEVLKGTSTNSAVSAVANANTSSGEPAATASQVKSATGMTSERSLHKVMLSENGTKNTVVFEVMPEIVEQHTVEYEGVAPPQFPGAFQKYKGNSSTSWQLNATFISRNAQEATTNYNFLMMLRGWTKPYFGERTAGQFDKKLGAPPPVLTMRGLRDLVGPVPVVITSLNWTWPKDVDYIPTTVKGSDGNYVPFPTILSVPIQLVESYSIDQFNNFSLNDYRAGRMTAAFNQDASVELPEEIMQPARAAEAKAIADGMPGGPQS